MSDYIPTELVSKILTKLPVKSLIRFTTVSKSWRLIITSPDFISSHLSNSKNHKLLHGYWDDDYREHYSLLNITENGPFSVDSSTELEFPFDNRSLEIVGCCDGLVCLSDNVFRKPTIIIWNPSVRDHVVLPNPTTNPTEAHSIVLGFGVASHSDIKVVRLVYYTKGSRGQVEIFCLETWVWRRLNEVKLSLRALADAYCRACLNGIVHWLAKEQLNEETFSILTFHIGGEVFGEVMLPHELARDANLCIFVIEESLGVVKYNGDTSCDVWVMKEYCLKESWTKLYTIHLRGGIEEVVGFSKSGEPLLPLVDVGLVAYYEAVTWDNVDLDEDLGFFGTEKLLYVDNYVESLLLLSGDPMEI